jgi:hypothetical protein
VADIDLLLSESLKRIAQPVDSEGVAEAIGARVAAGDIGTPATSSGFGQLLPGVARALPWIGLVVLAGLVGGALGVTGALGRPVQHVTLASSMGTLSQQTGGYQCIGGAQLASLVVGTRVVAVARSDDNSWVGVRNPVTLADTLWVGSGALTVDRGLAEISTLPVGGACPVVTVATDSKPGKPKPVAKPTTKPVTNPGDTSKPRILTASAKPTTVYNNGPAVVTVTATDNVGVTGVTATLSGAAHGARALTRVGGYWQLTFSSNSTAGSSYGIITFTLRAHDAAGNLSAPVIVTVERQFFG